MRLVLDSSCTEAGINGLARGPIHLQHLTMIQWYFVSLPSGQRGTYFCPYQWCMHIVHKGVLWQHLRAQVWFSPPSPDSLHTSFGQVIGLELWLGRKASRQNWKQGSEEHSCVSLLLGYKYKIQTGQQWFWLSLHMSDFSSTAPWVWRNDTFFNWSCLCNDAIIYLSAWSKIELQVCFWRTVVPSELSRIRYDDFVSIEDGIKSCFCSFLLFQLCFAAFLKAEICFV